MALQPPTIQELEAFRREEYPDGSQEETWAAGTLQEATDALWSVTGLEEYPADARAQRLVKYAIMDLTLWLESQKEHRDEINSPFSGERIGSYSYTKMQSAKRGEETGIYWLDLLFKYLRNPIGDDIPWATSENVFNPEGLSYAEFENAERNKIPDPYLHDFFGR